MNKRRNSIVRSPWLVLLFFLMAPMAAFAAEPSRDLGVASNAEMRSEARVALVIGNSAYGSGGLRNPVRDARAMATKLEELGFDVTLHTDLGYQKMRRSVVEFGQALRAGGVGLFYYAGHGIQHDGSNYLVPVDANISGEAYISVEAVDLATVLAGMDQAHNRLNLIILDACRNNPFERSFRSSGGGLAATDAPRGTLIAYATGPGRTAEDGSGRHSTYTAAVIDQMGKPGQRIEDLFKHVRVVVDQATGGRQIPWETSSLTGDFYFALEGARGTDLEPDMVTERQAADSTVEVVDSTAIVHSVPSDNANGGEHTIARHPHEQGSIEIRRERTAIVHQVSLTSGFGTRYSGAGIAGEVYFLRGYLSLLTGVGAFLDDESNWPVHLSVGVSGNLFPEGPHGAYLSSGYFGLGRAEGVFGQVGYRFISGGGFTVLAGTGGYWSTVENDPGLEWIFEVGLGYTLQTSSRKGGTTRGR